MSDDGSCEPDYTQYNEDSVPAEEREIEHTHPGRPDLDYDDTPVGPAEGAVCDKGAHHYQEHQKKEREGEEEN